VVQNADAKVTIAEIRTVFPDVTPATIYMWAQRDKIRRAGKRGRHPLFYWGDIVGAERETRLVPQSTRYEALVFKILSREESASSTIAKVSATTKAANAVAAVPIALRPRRQASHSR
jgi:hypothetical protein